MKNLRNKFKILPKKMKNFKDKFKQLKKIKKIQI